MRRRKPEYVSVYVLKKKKIAIFRATRTYSSTFTVINNVM